jgi:folate-binding protein YgfZ
LDAHYSKLEQDGILLIQGSDSLKFLQGQTTCDTNRVDHEHAVLGAYCNPQGRMCCDFLLAEIGQDLFALRMRKDIITRSAEVFGKYIIFSKATLSSDDSDWSVLAFWGADARESLLAIVPAVPDAKLGTVTADNYTLVQIDESGTRFECYLKASAPTELVEKFKNAAPSATEEHWHALQINAGIGRIERNTSETFIPQMLNYDITGHVNFTKGCYTGQEVVARLHYRGKTKRRAYVASLPSGELAEAGAALFSGESTKSVGNIVNTALDSHGKQMALIVATAPGIEHGLHLGAPDGQQLDISQLPYSIEKDSTD